MPQKRITRSGKTTWVARYRDPSGKQRSKSFPTRREAKAYEDEQNRAARRGEWVDPKNGTTVGDIVRDYVRLATKPGTRRDREQLLNNLGDLADMPLIAVRPSDLERWALCLRDGRPWAEGKPLAPYTAQIRVGQMRTVMSRAVDDGYLAKSPARVLRRFNTGAQQEVVVPEVEEVQALVEHAPTPWFRLAVRLASECGLRAGEVCGLRVKDVDLMRRVVHVRVQAMPGKAGAEAAPLKSRDSRRDVPLSRGLALALNAALEGREVCGDDRLLVSERGLPLFSSRVSQMMAKVRRKAGVRSEVHFHSLRHFFASRMLALGVPLPTVSALLGHSDVSVTARIYAHHLPDQLAVARQAVDNLEGFLRDRRSYTEGSSTPALGV